MRHKLGEAVNVVPAHPIKQVAYMEKGKKKADAIHKYGDHSAGSKR
jgi:hypothetical protein